MPKLPQDLIDWQYAFSEGLLQPFDFLGDGKVQTPREKIPPLAYQYVNHEAFERFETYHRQYWFRLLSLLQDDYLLVCRLMGAVAFNEVASAYLVKHPPQGAPLHELGYSFCDYLRSENFDELYIQAALVDHAYNACFYAPQEPLLDLNFLQNQNPDAIENMILPIAKHLFVLELDWDFIAKRPLAFAQNVEEKWQPDFEKRTSHWAIFRSGSQILSLEIDADHACLIQFLQAGICLSEALDKTAEQSSNPEQLVHKISEWFTFGVREGWFLRTA
jgi:hypothetical protein